MSRQRSSLLTLGLLLAIALLTRALPSAAAGSTQAVTPWVTASTHNGIVYFAFANPRRIERFQLSDASWLAPIDLPTSYLLVTDAPTALAVDDDGIFIALRRATYRMALDGSGAVALPNNSTDINSLLTSAGYVYMNGAGQVMSVSKATNATISSASYFYSTNGASIARGLNKIFARSTGISPADMMQLVLNADGTLGALTDSPYHGAYPSGSRTFVFPDQARVVDSSGTVYNTGNLTYSGSFGGAVSDLVFYGDLPIALRGNTLIAYTSNLLETGRHTLAATPATIALGGDTIYAFTAAADGTIGVEAVPLTSLGPLQPGAAIDPLGLAYSPDEVILGGDGIVYLLSRSNRSIFRWSLAERAYLSTIPLLNAPDYMALAEPTHRLYLTYPGGAITQIRLDEGFGESPLVNAPGTPCGLAAAGQYIFICSPVAPWRSHTVYDPDGKLVSTKDWNYFSYHFVWSAVNGKMYFLRDDTSPNDLHAEVIGSDGVIGAMSETPYHSSTGISHPVRVSPDGAYVLLGSGRVFASATLTDAYQLSNTITDAAWGSSLFSIHPNGTAVTQLQRWTAGYTLDAVADQAGAPLRLFSVGGQLLAIVDRAGVPQFTLWDESLNKIFESPPDKALRGLSAGSNSPVIVGSPTSFSAQVSSGSPASYSWDFGDGATGAGASVSHSYAAAGSYSVTVTASNAVSSLSAQLTATVNEPPIPTLYVSPASMAFSALLDGAAPAARRVSVSHTGPAGVTWSATADEPWISLSQAGGSAPGVFDVTVDPSGLGLGDYSGTVSVGLSDARTPPKQIAVSLSVTAAPPPPELAIDPVSMSFQFIEGGGAPPAQALAISHNGPANLAWSAAADKAWIELSASGGTAPASLNVRANPAGLEPGVYTGTLTVSLADPQSAAQKVSVSLRIEPAAAVQIALRAAPGLHSIRLSWTPPPRTDVARYRILRGPADAGLAALTTTRDTHYLDEDPGLVAGSTYCYQVEALRINGSVLAHSGLTCATYGQLGLWVPDVWGAPESLAVIPVNVRNASGLRIAASDIWLDIDGSIVEPVSVSATPLTAGYTWSYGVSGSGAQTRVRIAALSNSATPLVGDGSLFWLIVRVHGAHGASAPLDLRDYIQGVGGSTIYAPEDLAHPVPMALQDGTIHVDSAYTLGDLNGNGTIEAVDAYITLQIAAGKVAASPQQRAVGDVNGNGAVDAADATLILYRAAHGAWALQGPGQGQSVASLAATPTAQLSLDAVAGHPGELVTATLSSGGLSGWAGGRFVITYDPSVVEAVTDVGVTAATGAFSLQYYDDGAGMLIIAMSDDAAHSLSGGLLEISLRIAAGAPAASQSPLALADAQLNDALGRDFATSALATPVERSDGSLQVLAADSAWRVHLPLLAR